MGEGGPWEGRFTTERTLDEARKRGPLREPRLSPVARVASERTRVFPSVVPPAPPATGPLQLPQVVEHVPVVPQKDESIGAGDDVEEPLAYGLSVETPVHHCQ